MSVQGLACILISKYHYSLNSDVLSFSLSYLLHFFGFNFFKELIPIIQSLNHTTKTNFISIKPQLSLTLTNKSLNERVRLFVCGVQKYKTFFTPPNLF